MLLGLSLSAFTTLHVALSLIGIVAGVVIAFAMPRSSKPPGWTLLFLVTTVLTSITGFMFPFKAVGPPHVFGVISLVALAIAIYALYAQRLAGRWRWLYVTTALLSLYLNVVVLVVQAFQKLPALHQFAPKGSEPPVALVQLLVLILFVWLGVQSVRKFHPPA
jgi:hypothetical protein